MTLKSAMAEIEAARVSQGVDTSGDMHITTWKMNH
jgi:hypothetical protein